METEAKPISGGCLCGALRYVAKGAPTYCGYCCCEDCRKASGSGFIPFMGFAASDLTFTGQSKTYVCRSARGGEAVRNFCETCGGLVFGGIVGQVDSHTVYAGSLDDPTLFQPTMAIFTRLRPDWVVLPPGLIEFEGLPGG
jgi:hypothetical protein